MAVIRAVVQKIATILWQFPACLTSWRRPDALYMRLRASEILQQLQDENWTGLRQQFLPVFRWFIPVTLLSKGWHLVCSGLGPLESVGDPVITTGWWMTTAKVPVQFERANFGILLQMTPTGSLFGLRVVPQYMLGLGPGWQVPGYADGDAVRESAITLGKGQYKVEGSLCLPPATVPVTDDMPYPRYPCVVMLAGSGPCDRDSTVSASKPFKDLALGLAQQGIASIRFDKVTHTHRKALRACKDITLTDEYVEHAVDAVLQSQRHPDILPDQVYILGHSLGAVVAPTIAAADASIAGCILLAGPAGPLYRAVVRQLRYLASLGGPDQEALEKKCVEAQRQAEVADSPTLSLSTPASQLPLGIGPAYWLDYRRFEPLETAARVATTRPVLVLQGGRDYQVTLADDYEKWHAALHGSRNVEFHVYESLNHLFIPGQGLSTPLEYSVPGNVDEQVITDVSRWVSRTLN